MNTDLHVNEAALGYANVGAQDQADANMSIVGDGVYIDPVYGNKCAMEIIGANSLLIDTGAMWVNGRFVKITAPILVSLQSGTPNTKRHDIVCIKNTISAFGTPNALDDFDIYTFVGESVPDSSTPTDPAIPHDAISDKYATTYAPIARIVMNGVTPTVEPLMFMMPTLTDLISTERLADKCVTGDKVEDGTLSLSKLDSSLRDSISRIQGTEYDYRVTITVDVGRQYVAIVNSRMFVFTTTGNPHFLRVTEPDGTIVINEVSAGNSATANVNGKNITFGYTTDRKSITISSNVKFTCYVLG